jgi:hypothetical protein
VQYITTARELLEQLGAEITPEGTSRYSWVSMFSDGILFVLLGINMLMVVHSLQSVLQLTFVEDS